MFDGSVRARRSPWLRMAALASAFALSLASAADAYGLHRCPHHDALPVAPSSHHGAGPEGATPWQESAGQHAHAAHADDGAAEVAAAAGNASHDPASHDAGCTCVGDCPDAVSGVAPQARGETRQLEQPIAAAVVRTSSSSPLASHVPHFLPFAQGPPLDR